MDISFILKYYKNLPMKIHQLVLIALGTSLFFILRSYFNHLINQYDFEFSWSLVSVGFVASNMIWVLLSPMIYALTKSIVNIAKPYFRQFIFLLIGVVGLSILHIIMFSRFQDVVYYFSSGYMKSFLSQNNITFLTIGFFSSIVELLVIVSFFYALDYQRRYLTNQKELIEAQLNALRIQLQPHFLFNTLHSIASMIDINKKDAQQMISKLGNLLRNILNLQNEQMIDLEQEIRIIKDYLDLEQIRFQDRIKILYHIDDALLSYKVPNMILQPLVENAVKHGINPIIDYGEISVSAYTGNSVKTIEKMLILEIVNNYNPQHTNNTKGSGIGLENVTRRLEKIYQDRFSMRCDYVDEDKFVALIKIPIKK
jgi:hypothetical protein